MVEENVEFQLVSPEGDVVDSETLEDKPLLVDEGHILPPPTPVDDVRQDAPHSHNVEELALEVLDGKWGTGSSIRRRLVQHGIDPDPIMAEVARLK